MAEPKKKRKANPALLRPVTPTGPLADLIGSKARPRGQITKAVWDYIKKHKLNEGRTIHANDALQAVTGKATVTMFELPGLVNKHISA
jgi:chromatin remodeling complex protein RSC6